MYIFKEKLYNIYNNWVWWTCIVWIQRFVAINYFIYSALRL